jgi:hypothetical protein
MRQIFLQLAMQTSRNAQLCIAGGYTVRKGLGICTLVPEVYFYYLNLWNQGREFAVRAGIHLGGESMDDNDDNGQCTLKHSG